MKGILIARVSKGDQAKEGHYSLEVQVESLRAYAKKCGVEIVEEFVIEGESAYRGSRNKFTKAINKGVAMSGEEGFALFIQNPDRFSRQVTSQVVLQVEQLRKDGKIKIFSRSPEMVLHQNSSGVEKSTWNFFVMMAQFQSDNTSDKVKASVKYKLEQNQYPGFLPTGYLQKDGKIEIDKTRAPLIKEMFEMYGTGNYSIIELVKIFRQKRLTIKPKKDKEPRVIKKSDVTYILSCKTYTGWFDWNGVEYHATNYKPIISRKLFDKVQKTLAERAIKYSTKHVSTSEFHRYRGLLKCGFCGCTLTPDDMGKRYANPKPGEIVYRCTYGLKQTKGKDIYKEMFGENHSGVSNYKGKKVYNCPQRSFHTDEVEEHIKMYLKKLAYDREVIKKLKQKIGVDFKEKMSAITLQKKSIEVEVVKRQKLIEGLIDKLAMSELQDLTEDIQSRIKKIKVELEGLKAQLETVGEFEDSGIDEVSEALSITSDLYDNFDTFSPMGKRRMVINAFSEITLKKGWIDSEENQEESCVAKWTELFHKLWFEWVMDTLKNSMTPEQSGQEIGYQKWIDSLDDKYLEDTEEVDQEDTREEDIVKMQDSMRRAGRAWDISRRGM